MSETLHFETENVALFVLTARRLRATFTVHFPQTQFRTALPGILCIHLILGLFTSVFFHSYLPFAIVFSGTYSFIPLYYIQHEAYKIIFGTNWDLII